MSEPRPHLPPFFMLLYKDKEISKRTWTWTTVEYTPTMLTTCYLLPVTYYLLLMMLAECL